MDMCVLCMFAFGNICVLVLVFKLVLLLTYVCVLYIRVCASPCNVCMQVCSRTHTYAHINAHTCTQTGTHT